MPGLLPIRSRSKQCPLFLSALPAFHVLKIEIGCCPPQFYIQLFIVVYFLLHSCENSKSHWLKRCEENPTAIQVFCHVAKNLNSSKIYHPIFFFDFFVFCKVTNGYLDFVNIMKLINRSNTFYKGLQACKVTMSADPSGPSTFAKTTKVASRWANIFLALRLDGHRFLHFLSHYVLKI